MKNKNRKLILNIHIDFVMKSEMIISQKQLFFSQNWPQESEFQSDNNSAVTTTSTINTITYYQCYY